MIHLKKLRFRNLGSLVVLALLLSACQNSTGEVEDTNTACDCELHRDAPLGVEGKLIVGSNNQLFLNYKDEPGGRLRLLLNEPFKQRILDQFDAKVGLMRMSDYCIQIQAVGYYLEPEEERNYLHKKYDFCVCHITWLEES